MRTKIAVLFLCLATAPAFAQYTPIGNVTQPSRQGNGRRFENDHAVRKT